MVRYVGLLVTVLLLAACCRKNHLIVPDLCKDPAIGMSDCITDTNHLKSLIIGKWNWTQTETEFFTTNKRNPCTEKFNYSYEFLNNGQVNIYENGQQTSVGIYHFYFDWQSSMAIADTFSSTLHPEIYNAAGGVRLCGNYLIIDNSPVDGPKLIFLKN